MSAVLQALDNRIAASGGANALLARLTEPCLIQAPELSDDALALDFVARAAEFRWSHGLGWMVDNGRTWSRDDNMQRYDLARRVCREAANHCDDDGEAKRIASARTVSAALTMAQADPKIIVPAISVVVLSGGHVLKFG